MMKESTSNRRKQVTDEHHQIDPSLLGRPLATPWRRGFALVFDLFLLFFIYIFMSLFFVHLQSPQIMKGLMSQSGHNEGENEKNLSADVLYDITSFVQEQNNELFPKRIQKMIADSNKVALRAWADTSLSGWTINPFSNKSSTWEEDEKIVIVRGDVLYGKYSLIFGGITIFLVYFTLLTWALRGKTPGKWIFRLRVVPLDGKKLSLWNSFGRAAGYAASVSMGGLGFFETFWHPNRQAVHDRISGTVVVDERKREKKKKEISEKTVPHL